MVEQEVGVKTNAGYRKWNWAVLPAVAVLLVVVVGLLGSPLVAFAQDPAPGYTEGVWIAHTPPDTANFSGEGTSRIYWGSPVSGGQRSSYEFVGAQLPTPMPLNTSFVLGTFTHYNFPISGPSLQSATLSVAIDFADPAWPDQTFSYVFEHEETPNRGTCAYCNGLPPGTTCIPCPDRVTFPTAYGEESFRIGDQLYTLKIDGFRRQISDPTMEYFVTQENEANSAYLYATVSSVLVPEPAISIIKETSGDQSSWGDGVYIAAGAPVYWRYIVQNTGNVELTGISVTDDKGVQVTCPKTVLAKGESMTCTASGTAVAGSYSNIGTVVGTTPAGTDPATVSDTDPSSYFGSAPAVSIKKYTNGVDADDAPGPYIPVGGAVTWTYKVENTGNVDLTDVTVTDNQPGVTVTCQHVGPLAPHQIITCTASGTAIAGQYANVGTVVGYFGQTKVSDSDPSHYYGTKPGISIVKETSADQSTWGDGIYIPAGAPVYWRYIVTNTGNVRLTEVKVRDDQGVSVNCTGTKALAPGASMTCYANGTAVKGQYSNIGSAEGTTPAGTDPKTVRAEDPSSYFGSAPAVSIKKYTNDKDADEPTGPYIPVGGAVMWKYVVTNTGNVDLTNLVITDDHQGVTVQCTHTDFLAPGASMTCTASGTAIAGQYKNVGTVKAKCAKTGQTVSASDPSHYYGVTGLEVSKTATTTYTRTYTWGIDKSADGEYWKFIGEAPSTHSYTVAVERQASDSAWAVSGEITIKNTAPTGATIEGVSDVVSDNISAKVECDVQFPYELKAGETLTCKYSASLPDASDRENTVTVTTSGPVPGGTGTAKVVFGAPTTVVGPAEVTISDDKTGETWKASGSDSRRYSAEFSCPTDVTRYTDGVYSAPDFVNTATIKETNQSDSATVKVHCYAPMVSKTAGTTYDREYSWSIIKESDGTYFKFIGDPVTKHDYTVSVDQTVTDTNFVVSGAITVTNPNPNAAMTVSVADSVGAVGAVLDCGGSLTVPAGGSATCGYSAALPTATDGTNVATVTLNGIGFTGSADYSFANARVKETGDRAITVTDSYKGDLGSADGDKTFSYSREFACPTDVTRYTNGVYQAPDFVNTATITETNQSDSATVKLTCYAPVVSKTAEGTYTKTHNWAIEKTVNPASQAGSPGDVLPWTWTVKVSETPSNSGFAVSGEITVVNPNGQAELAASLSDQLNDGTVGAISGCTGGTYDGGILTVPAGGTAVCGYSALPSGLASTNVATVTLNKMQFSGQATVRWTPSIRNGTATVTDGQIGLNEVVTAGEGPWIRTGSGSHTCAAEDSGQYAATGSYGATVDNTATVTGSNGQTASADASTKYVCSIQAMPAIEIEKATNGEDADVAPGPYIPEGGAVTWRYVVTNTGNVDLTDVAVTDNMGVTPVYVSGDVNDDGILQVDETWVYEATGTAIAGQYENLGAVTAAFAATGETVSDSDPSHYFGSAPAIEIEKATNGEDADAAPGPYIPEGDPVTWTYVVTNTGNVTLTDVAVTDDQGVVVSCPQTTLAVGESMTCTASGIAVAGQYANIGTVSGTPPVGAAVSDEDPSHYFGSAPAIEIEKATNGEDADAAPGPSIPVGEAVTWTYVVTNTGNVDLTEVAVTDDRGVVVSCPQTTLAVGESMTCTGSGVAVAGQYVNEGTAVGSFGEVQVSDSDPSHYYGVVGGLKVTKEVELLQDAAQVVDPNMRFEICASGPSFSEPSCVQLKDGESHTWTGLIPGSYVVSETAPVHGLLSWAVEVVYEGGAEFATVVAEETAEVTVLNTADYQSPPTGIMVSEWEATVGQSGVLHTWRTIGEEDVSGFRVYRGSVGSIGEAELVGEVVAQGPSVYQWVDGEVSLGTWYYWLVEVDGSGEEGESIGPKTVTVGLGGQDNRNQRIYLPMTLLRG